MVTIELDGRVRAIKENFFKKFISDENFYYQLKQVENLQQKCLDAKRFDLAEQLAKVLFKAHEWFEKMKELEKAKKG